MVVDNARRRESPLARDRLRRSPTRRRSSSTIRDGVTWSRRRGRSPPTTSSSPSSCSRSSRRSTLRASGATSTPSRADGDDVTVHLQAPTTCPPRRSSRTTLIVPEHLWADVDGPDHLPQPGPRRHRPVHARQLRRPAVHRWTRTRTTGRPTRSPPSTSILPATNTQLDVVDQRLRLGATRSSATSRAPGSPPATRTRYWFPPGGTIALFPNLTKAPFDDVNVRRGIVARARPRRDRRAAAEGYMDAAGQTGHPAAQPGRSARPRHPRRGHDHPGRRMRARASSPQAGYTQQGGKLVDATGEQLEPHDHHGQRLHRLARGPCRRCRSQWGAIGIDVKIEHPAARRATSQALRNGDFDLAMGGMAATATSTRTSTTLLSSDFSSPSARRPTNNFERYSDPEVDALLARVQGGRSTRPRSSRARRRAAAASSTTRCPSIGALLRRPLGPVQRREVHRLARAPTTRTASPKTYDPHRCCSHSPEDGHDD